MLPSLSCLNSNSVSSLIRSLICLGTRAPALPVFCCAPVFRDHHGSARQRRGGHGFEGAAEENGSAPDSRWLSGSTGTEDPAPLVDPSRSCATALATAFAYSLTTIRNLSRCAAGLVRRSGCVAAGTSRPNRTNKTTPHKRQGPNDTILRQPGVVHVRWSGDKDSACGASGDAACFRSVALLSDGREREIDDGAPRRAGVSASLR